MSALPLHPPLDPARLEAAQQAAQEADRVLAATTRATQEARAPYDAMIATIRARLPLLEPVAKRLGTTCAKLAEARTLDPCWQAIKTAYIEISVAAGRVVMVWTWQEWSSGHRTWEPDEDDMREQAYAMPLRWFTAPLADIQAEFAAEEASKAVAADARAKALAADRTRQQAEAAEARERAQLAALMAKYPDVVAASTQVLS